MKPKDLKWRRLSRLMQVGDVQYCVNLESDGFIGVRIVGGSKPVKVIHVTDLHNHLNGISEPTTDRPAIIDKAAGIPMPREQSLDG